MKIAILGTGCPKCKKLGEMIIKALDELGIEAEVNKVTDINEIVEYGVMLTPALAIDGDVKFAGKLPSEKELKGYLQK